MNGCGHTFFSLKGWNIHHRAHHQEMILKCEKCKKRFTTPSTHRAHHNAHATIQFTCETCGHTARPENTGVFLEDAKRLTDGLKTCTGM